MVKVTKSRAPKETGGRDRDKDREMEELMKDTEGAVKGVQKSPGKYGVTSAKV